MDTRDALEALRLDRGPALPRKSATRRGGRIATAAAVAIAVLLALAGGGWWMFHPRPVLVRTITIEASGGAADSVLNASGYVVAQQQATVAAEVTGMVTAVYVQEGEHVAANQVLARLDDAAARATAAAAQSQLAADRALVPQYEAQLVKDQRTLTRTRNLATQGATSQADLDAAVAQVQVDESNISHARGQVQVDGKNFDLDNTLLSYTVIRAPFAGVVTERYAHPGEMISPEAVGGFTQTGICTLVDMASLEIDVDVNESYITRVHAGQRVDAVLDAYPDWHIPARVIDVVPTANEQKATVKVRIAFDRLDPRILPQMGVQVWFEAAALKPGEQAVATIEIPKSAVRYAGAKAYVYRLEGGRVHRMSIHLAPMIRGKVRVLSGLADGDRIVASGETPLKEGQEVREQ